MFNVPLVGVASPKGVPWWLAGVFVIGFGGVSFLLELVFDTYHAEQCYFVYFEKNWIY